MKKFNRIIVALDGTDFDKKLLSYFSHFTSITFPKKVYFVYVDPDLETPPNMDIVYKDENGKAIPKDELLKKVFTQRVIESFSNHYEVEFEVNVLEGKPLPALLHWAKVKDVDLFVLGNKKMSEGSGVVANRIARNTKAAVLFVPETSTKHFNTFLVPIDFSAYSELAMSGALELGREVDQATLIAFNVFDVPMTGYPMVNMNYERFVKNMAAFKQEAFDEYIKQFDVDNITIKTDYVENTENNVAKHINAYAHKNKVDLIVMGAKGHGLVERMLMGSVAEKLVSYDKEIPVLILRSTH